MAKQTKRDANATKRLSVAAATGFPAVYLTAYYAAFVLADVKRGDVTLVHSAAGGVGSALCRLLANAGATVIGVVGAPHKRASAQLAGATHVIDKSSENLWQRVDALAPAGFDSVFDANGIETLQSGFQRLAPAGRLIVYG